MKQLHNHGGNVSYFARELNIPEEQIIDYSANINPLGYPTDLKNQILSQFQMVTRYPDSTYHQLNSEIEKYYGVHKDNLILGNGAVELIYLLHAHLRPKAILYPVPTFSEYGLAAKSVQAEVEMVYLQESNNWELPIDELCAKLSSCQMLFICNPNNPTGNIFPKDKLIYLAQKCAEKNVLLIIDESFMDFITNRAAFSLIDQLSKFQNLFILQSLTKILGIPGLRIGFGLGNRQLIQKLMGAKDPWNVNCFAQLAAVLGLQDKKYLTDTQELIGQEKEYMFRSLSNINGLKPFKPQVNFILVKITHPFLDADVLAESLAKKGILIRNCRNFPGLSEKYFRLAIRERESNQLVLAAIAEQLKEVY